MLKLVIFIILILIIIQELVVGTKFFDRISSKSINNKSIALLPVLHNVKPEYANSLAYYLSSIDLKACTLSLRNPTAIIALNNFIQGINNDMIVGASTIVSELQIKEVKNCGAKFVSTMYPSYKLIKSSYENNISILCGAITYRDAKNALLWGAHGLKFYPSSQVSPQEFITIKEQIKSDEIFSSSETSINDISCYIAGGIKNYQYQSYLQAGLDGFAIGIDCDNMKSFDIANLIIEKQNDIDQEVTSMKLMNLNNIYN